MNSSIQLKINLPQELQELLETKARKFGVPLTQYVKHVLMKDADTLEYPIFKVSEATEIEVKEAMKDTDKAESEKNFLRMKNSARALYNLLGMIQKGSGLPKDLSEKHNEYTWD